MSYYLLGLYEKSMPHHLSLYDKLINTKASGFDYLEISIDETDEKLSRLYWNNKERNDLARIIDDTGVPIGSMCLSGHRKYPLGSSDSNIRVKSFEIMERAIDLSCYLGVRVIQIAGYDVYYEDSTEATLSYFLENLIKSTELAAAYGVVLAFETMETPFMDTVEKVMSYVKLVNSPYLQVYPDLGNLTNAAKLYNHDVTDDIKKGSGHIVALHLKETSPGLYRDVPFGSGHVDFISGISTAWSLGVRRFVGEFWDDGIDYQKQIDHANLFLRMCFDNLKECQTI